jgi:hypothetical protein
MSGAASAIRLKILSTDLPDGANQNPLFPQNNPLRDYPKSPLKLRPSRPTQEGRFASVTKRGAGCGGRGSVGRANVVAGRAGFQPVSEGTARRRPMLKRTAKSCGPGTRGWCHVSRRMRRPDRVRRHPSIRRQRWLKEFAHRGDHEVRRKPTAQGRREGKNACKIRAARRMCPHLCRDPMLIWMREKTWGHIMPMEPCGVFTCPSLSAATAVFQQTQPVLFVGGRRA